MIALTGAAGTLDEQHRLEREHVGADERGDDVEDPRVQHVALVDVQAPVQHVDAQQMVQPRLGRLVVRAERGGAGDGHAAGEQVVDMVEQLADLVVGEDAAHDEEALLTEVDVLVDGDLHRRDGSPRRTARRWPECASCCPRLISMAG